MSIRLLPKLQDLMIIEGSSAVFGPPVLDSGLLSRWQWWQNSIVVNKEEHADPKVKQRGMQKADGG